MTYNEILDNPDEMEKYIPVITRVEETDFGMWVFGLINGLKFEVKVADHASRFGIDDGAILKLWISSPISYGCIAAYDRGWDKLPDSEDGEAQFAIDALIEHFN